MPVPIIEEDGKQIKVLELIAFFATHIVFVTSLKKKKKKDKAPQSVRDLAKKTYLFQTDFMMQSLERNRGHLPNTNAIRSEA